jgi:predicted metal-dependent peptidase
MPIRPEDAREKLVKARISLLLQKPFWGTLATRLVLRDVTDEEWCKTAGTDGKYLYYNRDFIAKLNKAETIFLVAHEVEHCIYDHMARRGSRKPKLWNAAADFVINGELHEHNVGKLPDPRTSGVQACFDSKYSDMFTEQVYEELVKESKKNGENGSGDGSGYPEFDIHLEPGDGKGEPMTEEERRVLADEIQAAVYQAAKVDTGNLPLNVKRMIKDMTEPQMNWREILNTKLQSMYKSDFTWSRCSRKAQGSRFYLPGMKESERLDVAIAIDSSGSISDSMIKDFLGEVKGIMEQFDDYKVLVWCSDTEVYNPQTFTPDNMNDIDHYEIQGRGGNDFMCNWRYMKENDIIPERFLHFTDGYDCGTGFGDPNYCDTTYVIHSDPSHHIQAPAPMVTCWYEK